EGDEVVAVRVGGPLQLLVGARDVEDDVLVGDEPVRREEVLEGALEIASVVALRSELELAIGLVGHVVGARYARGGEQSPEEQRRDEKPPGPPSGHVTAHHIRPVIRRPAAVVAKIAEFGATDFSSARPLARGPQLYVPFGLSAARPVARGPQ